MGDWQHIMEQVKEKVEKLTEKDSLIFPIFTDWHTESVECEYTDRLVSA